MPSHPTAGLAALAKHSSTDLEELIQGAATYAQGVVSENTKRGYAREFARFKEWADEHGLPSLPTTPEVVAVYLGALASGKVSVRWAHGGKSHETMEKKTVGTIDRAHQGIVFAQREAGHEWMPAHPLIVRVMRGVRRTLGVKRKRVAALRLEELRLLLRQCSKDLAGCRNRALLLLGFFAALRRSELVALDVGDVKRTDKGLLVTIRRSKEDQNAEGRTIALPRTKDRSVCPSLALEEWLRQSKIRSGPIFRGIGKASRLKDDAITPQVVGLIIKQLAKPAGLDPARFSGHSLRAGFVTTAAQAGKSLHSIMDQTGHKSERTAMTYIRNATPWDDNAADGLA